MTTTNQIRSKALILAATLLFSGTAVLSAVAPGTGIPAAPFAATATA